VAKKPLPDKIKTDFNALVNCVAGAILVEEYTDLLLKAGFFNVLFVDNKNDLSVYDEGRGCCDTPSFSKCGGQKRPYDINEWVGSYQIYAVKSDE